MDIKKIEQIRNRTFKAMFPIEHSVMTKLKAEELAGMINNTISAIGANFMHHLNGTSPEMFTTSDDEIKLTKNFAVEFIPLSVDEFNALVGEKEKEPANRIIKLNG